MAEGQSRLKDGECYSTLPVTFSCLGVWIEDQLPAGAYHFCIRFERNQPYFDMRLQGKLEYNFPRGSFVLVGIGSGFWQTGVGLQVKNMVQRLSVNYLSSKALLRFVLSATCLK